MKLTPLKTTLWMSLIFIAGYTILVACIYPNTLRMMEANSWLNDWILQFFRWPWVGAFLMSIPPCAAMTLTALLLRIIRLPRLMPASLLVALWLAYQYPPTPEYKWGEDRLFSEKMKSDEQLFNYQRMASERQWKELCQTIRRDKTASTTLGARYLLLAESAMGTLAENLFTHPITETEQFLFRGYNNSITCIFNCQFYDNLGVWDECFHQAQEYAMSQRDFCFRGVCMMVDYSIAEAEWRVAEKLLVVLDEALFYHDFVADRRAKIAEGRKLKPVNDAPLRQDNFVSGYSFQNEMARLFQYKIGDQEKVQEYIMCSMLIRKHIPQFCKALSMMPRYKKPITELPTPFQQAIEINNSQGTALKDAPIGSYAYYYYNTEIPETEKRFEGTATN